MGAESGFSRDYFANIFVNKQRLKKALFVNLKSDNITLNTCHISTTTTTIFIASMTRYQSSLLIFDMK